MKKNRTVIGILCIVAALAISFGIAPLANRALDNKTEVIRIKKNIAKGQILTEEHIERVSVGAYNVPKEAIRSEEQIIGKYASVSMCAGDYVFPDKLTEHGNTTDDYLESLDGKKLAMSVSIGSYSAALSGKLKNGDIVSVMIVDAEDSYVPDELKYLKVITTTTSTGIDAMQNEGTAPATITLLVTEEQANYLAYYERNGTIYFSLVFRGDEKEAQKYLDAEDRYLEEMYGDDAEAVRVYE